MPNAMRELLEFYIDAGVDCALMDEPQDRFAESAAEKLKRQAVAKSQSQAGSQIPPQASLRDASQVRQTPVADTRPAPSAVAKIPNEQLIANARDLATAATTLEELQAALTGFTGCNLKNYAKSTVFADGNPQAKIMLVGEAPGRDEDIQGLPFVGRSGQLLDRMLSCIGLDRTSVYIANVIPWRPPGNRTPTPAETELCRPFVERQIALVNPDILVFVGTSSTKTLTGSKEGIMRMRGRWTTYQCNDRDIPVMPIFHPAYLLRQPAQKRLAWQDLLAIKRKLEESEIA
jgi:DNA polymerase